MAENISKELQYVAETAIRTACGGSAQVNSLERWGYGALNTCLKVIAEPPGEVFFLKIENKGILPRTRRGQIEREVYSMRLMQKAGIACPDVTGYDFSGSQTGRRYLLEAFIDAQLFWEIRDQMTVLERQTLKMDMSAVLEKMRGITSPYYGDIYPGGVIGQHAEWPEAYDGILQLLLADAEELELFSLEELRRVQEAFAGNLVDRAFPGPAGYYHGDLGLHNVMVDRSQGFARLGQVIDFGNALFYPVYVNDAHTRLYGEFGLEPVDVLAQYGISRDVQAANERLFALEGTLFRAMLKQMYNHDTGDFKTQFLAQLTR